jgi:hypothetical protein
VIRRVFVVTTVTVALIVGFAGVASAKTVSPGVWAPKFCAALSSWQDKLTTDGTAAQDVLSGQVTNLAAAKAELVSFLAKSVANTDRTVSAMQKAGAPSSPNGTQIAQAFVDALVSASTLFQSAKTKAQQAPTKSLKSFESVISQVTSALNKGGTNIAKSFASISKLDTSGQLAQSLQNEPSCAFLGANTSSGASSNGSG